LASEQPVERTDVIYADGIAMVQLLGPQDRLLRMLEKQHPTVQVLVRGNEITLSGAESDVAAARKLVDELITMTRAGHDLAPSDVEHSARILRQDDGPRPSEVLGEAILATRGKVIRPKTLGQKEYVDAIDENTIVFGIGPAVRARHIWPWRRRCRRCSAKRSNASSSPGPPSRRGSGSGFCLAHSPTRSTRICARCTTR
jgi:phosphate starvation-inducible PhoH-like protein